MTDFADNAAALADRLREEASAGRRDPGVDSGLRDLRRHWLDLEGDEREAASGLSETIASLVSSRPTAGDEAMPSPAGGPARPGDEQAQATLALQGIEELDPAPAATRAYSGPRSPEPLLTHLGYDDFRPGQRQAVEAALDGRDALVVMPTGGGKSLCYQLPGLAGEDLTIVVSPLIALMSDQVKRLADGGHPAVMLASGLSQAAIDRAFDQIRSGGARIVYCSPERFGSASFLEALGRRRIDLFAIDEAHCLSEWGHDFRPDYLRLPKALERLGRPPVMACTATATEEVAAEIVARLGMEDPLMVRSGFDRPNLSFDTVTLEGTGSKARKQALLEHGLADPANLPAIVYCGTRKDTEEVAGRLAETGIVAVAYHAGMQPDERASAQHRFMEGDASVVVATNAFGMGVDKADVRSVWHWAIPSSVEAYYQEAGRAGRDGLPARAVLLAMRSDLGRLVRFNQRRAVDPADVIEHVGALEAAADSDGGIVIDAPRRDEQRILLAVAERAGACSVEPAPGGRIALALSGEVDRGRIAAACRVAIDRGWRAYRAVEAYSFSDSCRRRMLLDHFGDDTPAAASGRCCDVCDPDGWLPDPSTLRVRKSRANPKGSTRRPPADLDPAGMELYEALRGWRLEAAGEKPAYTVANNRTLEAISAVRPSDVDELSGIHGVGPAFLERHGAEVLRIVSRSS